eukprot:gnl/MRDRNA2_/MRDRNA2_99361_c0_seq1.p1 gnl/MRDRNA2_/MRDRNA2_99361_c0~~gnl/MRDRNA2_/MRDRNA2_99361_c0_seq1.p1  ORF type:complete len:174 (-),score=20.26 gnl/MRDRNA2_/MRDRNA2_99361_c0_seq1:334-855(-)
MKWPRLFRKKASSDKDVHGVERCTEVAAKIPFVRSSTLKSTESLSTISGSTTASNCSSYMPQTGSQGAVDPRERPSVQRLVQERVAKMEMDAFSSEDSSTGRTGTSPVDTMPTVAEDDNVIGVAVVEYNGWGSDSCVSDSCMSKHQVSGLANWWTENFFACSMTLEKSMMKVY